MSDVEVGEFIQSGVVGFDGLEDGFKVYGGHID